MDETARPSGPENWAWIRRASLQDLFPVLSKTQGCVDPRCARLDSTPGLGQEGRPCRAPGKGHCTKLERACQHHQMGRRPIAAKDCPLLWRPSSGPPKRRLSLSQAVPFPSRSGGSRRSQKAESLSQRIGAIGQAEGSSPSPERPASPKCSPGCRRRASARRRNPGYGREQTMSSERTVLGGANRRKHESDSTGIALNRGGRSCPTVRP